MTKGRRFAIDRRSDGTAFDMATGEDFTSTKKKPAATDADAPEKPALSPKKKSAAS